MSEREKARRGESDKRLLSEVRRLLGASVSRDSRGPGAIESGEEATESEHDGAADEIVMKTPFGQFSYRPPFPLEDHEVELLRLVAREDEITAEQIRHLKGRRALNELDELLDRLADEGMNPVVEVNDRYSFDPSNLQSD